MQNLEAKAGAPASAGARPKARNISETRTISVLRKNNASEIRVRVIRRDGFNLVDTRVFATNIKSKGHPQPSGSGFCIVASQLGELIAALQAAEREAQNADPR